MRDETRHEISASARILSVCECECAFCLRSAYKRLTVRVGKKVKTEFELKKQSKNESNNTEPKKECGYKSV